MVSMVEHGVIAEMFLELANEAGCKTWLLLEVSSVQTPLVFQERVQMLREGRRKPLEFEPFGVGCLECEKITCFAGVERAAHVGIQEDTELWWEM